MRLLTQDECGGWRLVEYYDDNIPPYAILSHTWITDDEEVSYRDLENGAGKDKAGYKKIEFCEKRASRDGLQYFWVDTCCIDKSSSTELSEAINSMFQWYERASRCYVYLSDVSATEHTMNIRESSAKWEAAFRHSRWFRRGWTLQELLAPRIVEFYSSEGILLGSKLTLERMIHDITKIPQRALIGDTMTSFGVEERFFWAEHRETKRQEDKAYSLFGIFNVHMPLLYGEGYAKAFIRFREEIQRASKRKWEPEDGAVLHDPDIHQNSRAGDGNVREPPSGKRFRTLHHGKCQLCLADHCQQCAQTDVENRFQFRSNRKRS